MFRNMSRNARFYILPCLLCLALCACAGKPNTGRADYVDAVELKLKCRELADQMLATMPNDALQGFVAMPVAFVDQNNSSRSSPLGRLIAESLFYEFNQRGFPTREYRLSGAISVTGGRDDLALVSNQIVPTQGQKWAALIVGTYYVEKNATFVNARLVRASDGLVLRTGQLVLVNTPVVARMGKPDAPVSSGSSAAGPLVTQNSKNAGKATKQTETGGLYAPLYTPADMISTGKLRIIQGR
ncbi:MAG: hypothetical protein LBR31_08140 [Desulfovibrio sp.]|jgi:hypothetical protein|nr:hypothetical protein [Desulfovibrio sp.]